MLTRSADDRQTISLAQLLFEVYQEALAAQYPYPDRVTWHTLTDAEVGAWGAVAAAEWEGTAD